MQFGGGLHPRLSLARAILADRRTLILDEAISSVDAEAVVAITGDGLMAAKVAFGRTIVGTIVGILLVFSGSC